MTAHLHRETRPRNQQVKAIPLATAPTTLAADSSKLARLVNLALYGKIEKRSSVPL